MDTASINEIKKELLNRDWDEMLNLCLRLAKFKKENKELLSYLLFNAHDEGEYVKNIKEELASQFAEINKSNLYWAKKSLRKILKNTNKFIRYSGLKNTELELLLFFCLQLKESGIPFRSTVALNNLYQSQIKKIRKVLLTLHEDLRYDYEIELEKLNS